MNWFFRKITSLRVIMKKFERRFAEKVNRNDFVTPFDPLNRFEIAPFVDANGKRTNIVI